MASSLCSVRCVPASSNASLSLVRRPNRSRAPRTISVVRAKQGRFDEGSAEVRRIVNRDLTKTTQKKEESTGPKSLDDLEKIFETSDISSLKDGEAEQATGSKPPAGKGSSPFRASKAASPFGSSSAAGKPASPFGGSSSGAGASGSPFGAPAGGKASSPFGVQEPAGLSPNMQADPVEAEPWWAFVKELKTAQIVTVISFTLIIGLMLATFKVVLDSGAIHFNE